MLSGLSEFGDGGMGVLLQAAANAPEASVAQDDESTGTGGANATTGEPPATEPPTIEVQAVPIAPQEEWPKESELDPAKLAQARLISQRNKPPAVSLAGFKPVKDKPRKAELWQAVMERDATQRPKNWGVAKMVTWLQEHDPAVAMQVATTPGGEALTLAVVPLPTITTTLLPWAR